METKPCQTCRDLWHAVFVTGAIAKGEVDSLRYSSSGKRVKVTHVVPASEEAMEHYQQAATLLRNHLNVHRANGEIR